MVQVLCISGSPRKDGNTEAMIEAFHRGAKTGGANSVLVKLRELKIIPCDGCEGCEAERGCHIDDDLRPVFAKLKTADVWVFASPVYWWNISGLLKIFIDRFEQYWGDAQFKELCKKKSAVILTCGGQSMEKNTEAEDYLEKFFTKMHLIVIGKVRAQADEKETVSKKVLDECFELGKKIAITGKSK
ncbi:MAG: flavodoxin family protein [Candidatus Diapherotrites archaeon]|nr:flavodoxin family protein [Candidatus Diapherotrites archaeon]